MEEGDNRSHMTRERERERQRGREGERGREGGRERESTFDIMYNVHMYVQCGCVCMHV